MVFPVVLRINISFELVVIPLIKLHTHESLASIIASVANILNGAPVDKRVLNPLNNIVDISTTPVGPNAPVTPCSPVGPNTP